jgi:hypothetical protein
VRQPVKAVEVDGDSKMTFAFPMNWSGATKYNLLVSIPEGFKTLQSAAEIMDENSPAIEFVPKA